MTDPNTINSIMKGSWTGSIKDDAFRGGGIWIFMKGSIMPGSIPPQESTIYLLCCLVFFFHRTINPCEHPSKESCSVLRKQPRVNRSSIGNKFCSKNIANHPEWIFIELKLKTSFRNWPWAMLAATLFDCIVSASGSSFSLGRPNVFPRNPQRSIIYHMYSARNIELGWN